MEGLFLLSNKAAILHYIKNINNTFTIMNLRQKRERLINEIADTIIHGPGQKSLNLHESALTGGKYTSGTLEEADEELIKKLKAGEVKELENLSFGSKNLTGITFRGMHIKNVNFNVANLDRAEFLRCRIENVSFYGTSLKNALFENTNIDNVDFTSAYLPGTNFSYVDMTRASFYATKLQGAVFYRTYLNGIDGMFVDLTEAYFWYCKLYHLDLSMATSLKGTKFSNVKTSGCKWPKFFNRLRLL